MLWAESEAEAWEFIKLTKDCLHFTISDIFIAKRSGGKRDVGAGYIRGEYFHLDTTSGFTSTAVTSAPSAVTETVQWCSQDMILTKNNVPFIAIESTYHLLTYNNIAQRMPRQIRSAMTGTPSVIFQKVTKSSETLNAWFAETFLRATKIFKTPALAIMFDDSDFESARGTLCQLINTTYVNNNEQVVAAIMQSMAGYAEKYEENKLLYGRSGQPRTWLEVTDNQVIVKIGVKDNCALVGRHFGCQGDDKQRNAYRALLRHRPVGEKGCVWLSKGTGGMDPYPGLVKLAEILFCYDKDGSKTKQLVTKFTKLPKDFWWFQKYPNEIYYRLVREFSDRVEYADDYKS